MQGRDHPAHPTTLHRRLQDDSVSARTTVDTLILFIKAVGLVPIWQEMNDALWQVIQGQKRPRDCRGVAECPVAPSDPWVGLLVGCMCAILGKRALMMPLRTRCCPRAHLCVDIRNTPGLWRKMSIVHGPTTLALSLFFHVRMLRFQSRSSRSHNSIKPRWRRRLGPRRA